MSAAELQKIKRDLIGSALEKTTLANYASLVKVYCTFCADRGVKPWPAKMDCVEDCTAWCIYSGSPSTASNLWSAILYYQQNVNGYAPVVKSFALKQLHVKALKLSAAGGRRSRDPIPVEAVQAFCRSGNRSDSRFVQQATMITVGIRALLRQGELSGLRLKDVSFTGNQAVLDLGTRKNHKEKAVPLYLDPSDQAGSVSCPVWWLRRHVEMRKAAGATGDDFLFAALRGGRISQKGIQEAVDAVSKVSPTLNKLYLTTHSLRITGAVYMMTAGFSALDIQVMGDWKSDIFLRYLRTVGIAAQRATTRMGL